MGLLASAAARSRATAFGEDAYPSIHDKAASLLHSLARTQPLIDGNKRLALAATIAFYGVNGLRLTLSNTAPLELTPRIDVLQLFGGRGRRLTGGHGAGSVRHQLDPGGPGGQCHRGAVRSGERHPIPDAGLGPAGRDRVPAGGDQSLTSAGQ